MDGLDFSGLTDDQLVELARACCMEAIARSPSASAAMLDMMQDEALKARQKADIAARRDEVLLQQAAQLVDRAPSEISLLYVHARGKRRVYINSGVYRFSSHHLVAYEADSATITTVAALRGRQRELIEFCAGLTAVLPLDTYIRL